MSSYIITNRNKTSEGFGNKCSTTSYLIVPDNENSPLTVHKTSLKNWMNEILNDANNLDSSAHIILYVHGYNSTPDESLERQRQIEKQLKRRDVQCIVVGFDWPANSSALEYLSDRKDANISAQILANDGIIPFALYNNPNCTLKVHIISHSMGCFIVREAFRNMDKMRLSNPCWKVNQIVFVAGDISSSCFEKDNADMLPVFNHCNRLTNYFSGCDLALILSNMKNLDIDSRVGRVGMPTDNPGNSKAIDIDCSERYFDNYSLIDLMESHEWYFNDSNWYSDLKYTIEGKLDRNVIPTRIKLFENDFKLLC